MQKTIVLFVVAAAALLAGSTAAKSIDPANRWVRVTNYTASSIVGFKATSTYVADWGDNLLDADEAINPLQEAVVGLFDDDDTCRFDVRAFLANGRVVTLLNANVCGGFNWSVTYDKWSH